MTRLDYHSTRREQLATVNLRKAQWRITRAIEACEFFGLTDPKELELRLRVDCPELWESQITAIVDGVRLNPYAPLNIVAEYTF